MKRELVYYHCLGTEGVFSEEVLDLSRTTTVSPQLHHRTRIPRQARSKVSSDGFESDRFATRAVKGTETESDSGKGTICLLDVAF